MPEDDNELAKLKKEVADLKQRIDPPPRQPSTYQPPDYTAGMSMDRSAMQAMIDVSVTSGIAADAFKPNPMTVGPNPQPQSQPAQRGTGWIEERGFPDRTKEFELMDRIVKKMVGGPNDPVK
jgi:hypothetical protein